MRESDTISVIGEIKCQILNCLSCETLKELCSSAFDCELFKTAPAAKSFHHNFKSGLLIHTLEVVAYSLTNAKMLALPKGDVDGLLTAAVWHDYSKIEEYEMLEGVISYIAPPDYKGHLEESYNTFEKRMFNSNKVLNEHVLENIRHCMLSHHGRIEWGALEEPRTQTALILHQADMVSSRFSKRNLEGSVSDLKRLLFAGSFNY